MRFSHITMGHRQFSTVGLLIVIAVSVTIIQSKPTVSTDTPAKTTPSSCVGGTVNGFSIRATVQFAKNLRHDFTNVDNGLHGLNKGLPFSREIVQMLTSTDRCLLPLYKRMQLYKTILKNVPLKNITDEFRTGKNDLQESVQVLLNSLDDICCTEVSTDSLLCCSLMLADQEGLPQIDFTALSSDGSLDSFLRNLTDALLKSLDGRRDGKRSIRHKKRNLRKRDKKRGKGRRQTGKKRKSAGAGEGVTTKVQTDLAAKGKGGRRKEEKEENQPAASGTENPTEQSATPTGIQDGVKPTEALAPGPNAGKRNSEGGDDAVTKPRRRKRRCGKGKRKGGRRCRGKKGKKNRKGKKRGKNNRRRNRRRKSKAAKSRGNKSAKARSGSKSRRGTEKNESVIP